MGKLASMLDIFCDAEEDLYTAGYFTTGNTPASNLALTLVSRHLRLELVKNKPYSMATADEKYIAVKGAAEDTESTGLIAGFRGPDAPKPYPFDFLVIVQFGRRYRVVKAACLPYKVVAQPGVTRRTKRGEGKEDGWVISLTPGFWETVAPQGEIITEELQKTFYKI